MLLFSHSQNTELAAKIFICCSSRRTYLVSYCLFKFGSMMAAIKREVGQLDGTVRDLKIKTIFPVMISLPHQHIGFGSFDGRLSSPETHVVEQHFAQHELCRNMGQILKKFSYFANANEVLDLEF